MDVGSLKKILEDLYDDVEIRLAFQPSWPFEYHCSEVVAVNKTDNMRVLHYGVHKEGDENIGWYIVDESYDPQDEEYWVDGPAESSAILEQKLEDMARQEPTRLYFFEGHQIGYLNAKARAAGSW
jgi:hypothetical protein